MDFSLEHRTFFIVGFVVYVAILIVVGIICSRKNKDGEDYLLAGRKLPFILLLGTISATLIGTGSSLGATANGFRSGWYGSLYGLGGALGMFVLAFLFCSERDYKFMTLSEEMQFRFGGSKKIRDVMGFFLFIAEIAWLGNHMNGGATYLSYVTGLDSLSSRFIIMVAFGVYVFIGGYLAVVITDNVQILLILCGFLLILFKAVPFAGGWQAINDAYVTAGKPAAMGFYGLASVSAMTALSLAYTVGISQVGTPGFRTRVYSAVSNGAAKKAFFLSGIVLFLFSFIPAIIGMSGFALATREGATAVLNNPNFTFAYMATTILGPTLGLMFLIAGLSATLSSADSDAMAGITILLVDVYSTVTGKSIPKEKMVFYSRVCLVITLLAAFLATLFAQDIIGYISNVVGALIPSIAMMMILGKFWKRATWQGGIACIFSGTIFGLLYLFVGPFQKAVVGVFTGPAIPVSLVALAAGIIVSLVTPKVIVSEEEALRLVIEARERTKA
ncbi:MAG: sodium:solute symporter family protein [Spirochaetaceae bacterium]|jgi:SSS family solute:Na+ symporter|nr:sodium:solute symporter family protein [Spirochaetaceae bacterium]